MINRGFPYIISCNLVASKKWYVDLLGLDSEFDIDCFAHLKAPNSPGVELRILDASHDIIQDQAADIVPDQAAGGSGGPLLTFFADDVDKIRDAAADLGHRIIERGAPTVLPVPGWVRSARGTVNIGPRCRAERGAVI